MMPPFMPCMNIALVGLRIRTLNSGRKSPIITTVSMSVTLSFTGSQLATGRGREFTLTPEQVAELASAMLFDEEPADAPL